MFIIEAEWFDEKKEQNKANSSQMEALTMPPEKAAAIIVWKFIFYIFTLLKFDVLF